MVEALGFRSSKASSVDSLGDRRRSIWLWSLTDYSRVYFSNSQTKEA